MTSWRTQRAPVRVDDPPPPGSPFPPPLPPSRPRMPADTEQEWGVPKEYPYMSVCSTSSHDTSTLRCVPVPAPPSAVS